MRPRPWRGRRPARRSPRRRHGPGAPRNRRRGRGTPPPCSGSRGRRRLSRCPRRARCRRRWPCDSLCARRRPARRRECALESRLCSRESLMDRLVRIGHSPAPDDAFMSYALPAGKVRIPGVRIEHVLEDIETLNRRSRGAELEVTAVSFATYTLIADRYRMMDPGASMGKGYGPILVAREPIPRGELEQRVTAIAGKHTTSALLLRLYVGDPPLIEVAFDKIPTAVLEGQAELGLLIHEGQITYQTMGLTKVLDIGEAWQRDTGLPLPLGCNVMRRDLGDDLHRALSQALRDSIAWAHAHVDEALEYA